MKTKRGYDPLENRITVNISTKLLIDYFDNLKGLIYTKDLKTLLKDIKVKRLREDEAEISFPVPKEASLTKLKEGVMIALPPEIISPLFVTIDKFKVAAYRKKSRTTEFIPLSGYPIEDLKKDVVEAVNGERDYCLIDTYENYLKNFSNKKIDDEDCEFIINHYYVKFGTEQYNNICLDILNGNLDRVVKEFKPKLKRESWI